MDHREPIIIPSRAGDAAAGIFGKARPEITDTSVPDPDVQVSGIVYSNGSASLALISVDGNLGVYGIGQDVDGGEIITAIEPAAVVLGNGSQTRRIELDIEKADSNAAVGTLGLNNIQSAPSDAGMASTFAPPISAVHRSSMGIAVVPSVAGTTGNTLSLSDIRAKRAARFSGIDQSSPMPILPHRLQGQPP